MTLCSGCFDTSSDSCCIKSSVFHFVPVNLVMFLIKGY